MGFINFTNNCCTQRTMNGTVYSLRSVKIHEGKKKKIQRHKGTWYGNI